MPAFRTGPLRRRVLVLTLGVFALLGVAAAPVAAVEPVDARDPAPVLRRGPPPEPTEAPTPTPTVIPARLATLDSDAPGYDISWPQCGDPLPEAISFAIVGVNGGRVYRPNPCLGIGEDDSQLEWAGPQTDLYLNTGNPGPDRSNYWPHGHAAQRECDTAAHPGADTADCAYLYGWNAAADSYRIALEAFIALEWAEPDADRVPGERTWWLDVEVANTWRLDWSLNVATLQGAVDYLESMDVTEVGFYSTPLLWWRVTGGTDAFADNPAWHAGALDQAEAEGQCDDDAFTGGELRIVQWVENGLDHNHRCPPAPDSISESQ